MSLITNLVGGRRHRSRRNKRTKKGGNCATQMNPSPYPNNNTLVGGKRKSKRGKKKNARKTRKGGLSSQLVPLGFLASLLSLPKKGRKSHKKR